jgi:hypothetical protein
MKWTLFPNESRINKKAIKRNLYIRNNFLFTKKETIIDKKGNFYK